MISVIVPVYNEEQSLPALLPCLDALTGDHELLFADGGSSDGTLALLAGRRVLTGAKGRAAQCNLAAERAGGSVLFFLHCDSILGKDTLEHIRAAVEGGADWGCLILRFDDQAPVYRLGAAISNLRVRLGGIAFGDQGIFMTRRLFQDIGGFPALPLMEDYELSLRLKKRGIRPVQVKSPLVTSARRFQQGGPLRVGWRMQWLRALYRRGVAPEELARLYRDVRKKHG